MTSHAFLEALENVKKRGNGLILIAAHCRPDGDSVSSVTATAAVLAGAKLVFVDIRPDTMNIDETKIEKAITSKTKVIIAMHYAGVACEMDTIMDIAKKII